MPAEFEAALAALAAAGVPLRLRRRVSGNELDVWLPHRDIRSTDAVLTSAGYVVIAPPAATDHRFYVKLTPAADWIKIDAKLENGTGPAARSLLPDRIGRALPTSARRPGVVVAILGPDGSGKGTVIEGLRRRVPLGVRVLYLGTRSRTRAVSAQPSTRRRDGVLREVLFVMRKELRLGLALARGYAAAWAGHVVLCDRHPLEAAAIRPSRPWPAEKIEMLFAKRFIPRPDAIVVLDAPAATLRERKQEHELAVLELWRARYRETFPDGVLVDTSRTKEEALEDVSRVIWAALTARQGGQRRP